MSAVFVSQLVDGARVRRDVRIGVDASGRVSDLAENTSARPGDLALGTAMRGAGDAHSHAFHRGLRGRTHANGGDFWSWRERMYELAARLDPDSYRTLARGVFAELLAAGYTAVGEFHYAHHRADGAPFADPNAVGLALADAAEEVGIRLTLLDTCYLTSAPRTPLTPAQRAFDDGSVDAWFERWSALRPHGSTLVTIGAAAHSVRAVPPEGIARMVELLPTGTPLHAHLSEQPHENAQSLAAYGRTPTGVLADAGALRDGERLSVVHATHLTDDDTALLGAARVTAVFCPTTEADLGDGLGPARELADAGARLAIGSDQNAVVDPFEETRTLETGQRMRRLQRGCFTPAELDDIRSAHGYAALGLAPPLTLGGPADLVEVDTASARTLGADPLQLALAASAADVTRVVVGGRVAVEHGRLADGRAVASVLREGLAAVGVTP
ncbi:MAG: formimidoylglutamate deiminase [Microbacterium sp.]|uniref:formimidoylglutamate deiminase n=1 Tax=Microbacterium sp. TaxID=51671 RepID=UPI0039E551B4